MNCYECEYKRNLCGDCHIQCTNPPKLQQEIGSGGNERYIIAKEMSKKNKSVVRCIWYGSGIFPIAYDGNTVFGCCNFKKKDEKQLEKKEVIK